jgi:hypothetical protein
LEAKKENYQTMNLWTFEPRAFYPVEPVCSALNGFDLMYFLFDRIYRIDWIVFILISGRH